LHLPQFGLSLNLASGTLLSPPQLVHIVIINLS
jgi:hypothetical protein